MFGVDKIALIRRAHFSDGKKIKEIVRELAVSRNVVRKVVRSGRQTSPTPGRCSHGHNWVPLRTGSRRCWPRMRLAPGGIG